MQLRFARLFAPVKPCWRQEGSELTSKGGCLCPCLHELELTVESENREIEGEVKS